MSIGTTRPVTGDKGQTVDPQLHVHATVLNATFDSVENKWKAIQLGDVVRDKGYYQSCVSLAACGEDFRRLVTALKRTAKASGSPVLTGRRSRSFPPHRRVIETEAERLGITDAKTKGELGRRTREKKSKSPIGMSELRGEWDSRLTVRGASGRAVGGKRDCQR